MLKLFNLGRVIRITALILAAAAALAIPVQSQQTTWFVRPDGGTRYSTNVPQGQCDGKADVAYPGTGTNLHCAFNDFRYMWDDDSGVVGQGKWIILGGDTIVVRGCHALPTQMYAANPACRLGWDVNWGGGATNQWCTNVGAYGCNNPPIPAGTAAQHTRILGGCAYGTYTCTPVNTYPLPSNNLTQLFGGMALTFAFNVGSTQYVDIEGIELTTHNGTCVSTGTPAYPKYCNTNYPVDDFSNNGFQFNNTSSNILLQDVYVHGFTQSGLYGPIGGPFTLTRVVSGFGGFAGWNFADNANTPNGPGSSITASYVTMIGNGCYEQYPIKNAAFPAQACYDDVSNGFGDSWSGQDTNLDSFICDHCVQMYNTKDGFIGPHAAIKTLTITNSASIGNMGQQWKWGGQVNSTTLFQNNLTVGNCGRMASQIPGAAQNFALSTGLPGSYLSDFCRAAGNTFDILTQIGSNNYFYGNTIVMADPTGIDYDCGPAGGGATNCGQVLNLWQDNLFLGYTDPVLGAAPGLWYTAPNTNIVITSSYNTEFGIRNGDTCGVNNITCFDPMLVNEPSTPWPGAGTNLDVFNPFVAGNSFYPAANSPLVGAGIPVAVRTTDYYGATVAAPPTIGAVSPSSITTTTPPTSPPPTQVWTKVANENDVVNVPAGTTVRYGYGTQWDPSVTFTVATTFTASNAYFGTDPIVGQVKEVDALGTGAGITTGAVPPPVVAVAPVLTWANPASIVVTTPLSATQLNATASTPGKFTYTPAAGAYLPIGTTTLSVSFVPTDTVHFTSVIKTASIVVTAPPVPPTPAAVSVTCTASMVNNKISVACK